METRRRSGRLAIGVPVLVGLGLLGGALLLLPGRREIVTAERRAKPVEIEIPPIASPPVPAVPPPAPTDPALAAVVRTADATRLAALTARLIAEGKTVTTLQVAYDLVAVGRPAVALAYLAARPDGNSVATWRLRFDLLHKTGREAEAAALLTAAVRARTVAPADIVAAGYAFDRPDLIVAAAVNGALPSPDLRLALDLARRLARYRQPALLAALDRAPRADWRRADPWLAIRLASGAGDTAAALRAVDHLPADQQDAARDTILGEAGDAAGLRASLLARAATPGADGGAIAERLLATGHRDDAIAVLKRVVGGPAGGLAGGLAVGSPTTQRLLYLMGPRPAAADLGWLRDRAMGGSPAEQLAWLAVYADRDRPATALAFASRHPLASRTDVLMMRLSLARAAGDDGAARTALAGLLDGRALTPAQVRSVSAAMPTGIDAAQSAALARRRVAAGVAAPGDRMDLAWGAWNGGDAKAAAGWLRDHLATAPTDLAALRLMADVQARLGGAAAARPYLEKALAQSPTDSRGRAELLDRLGRRGEALALVERLRGQAPNDRALAALQARLLIAAGQPGRARAVLAR